MGINFHVDARGSECFFERLKRGTPVTVMFQVIRGGFLDIDFAITSPEGNTVYSAQRQTEGKYNFIAESDGPFAFCFSNKISTMTPKFVSFVLSLPDDTPSERQTQQFASEVNLNPLENTILQLSEALKTANNEQAYMRMRMKTHFSTNESTNRRILWWSLTEIGLLLALSVWQVYFLKKFFEVKRPV